MSRYDALLLNLEGTITSLSFIKHKLYVYAKENAAEFIRKNFQNAELQEALEKLRYCATVERRRDKNVVIVPDAEDNRDDIIAKSAKNIVYWISGASQLPAVTHFLRLMWKFAYEYNELKASVYDDIHSLLEQITPIPVYIYGSYVVAHQKMFFAHTTSGDLTKFITGYFDETVGAKANATSYKAIATEIGAKPARILYVTCSVSDARAAKLAGFLVLLLSRHGNVPFEANVEIPVLNSLTDIADANCIQKLLPLQQL